MIFELIETEDYSVVKRTDGDGIVSFVPVDTANADYNQYLAFNEWVKAGNKPDDFWKQGDEQ
jgi:hypothetical protein